MKTDMLNPDGSINQLALPDLDGPNLYSKTDAERRAVQILARFKDVHKTESAFYLAFCRLTLNDRAYMLAFWHMKRDFEVFRRLCMLNKIRAA
jgi:hypothetical protein